MAVKVGQVADSEFDYAAPSSRRDTFKSMTKRLSSSTMIQSPAALVVKGDSLELLHKIPDSSISLILTDPPYHVTKKHNIHGDKAFANDDEYLEWMAKFAKEWRRILKFNGSVFCFCDTSMSARLEVMLSTEFNILSHVVWTKPNLPGFDGWKGKMKKEALRQFYPHSERILFCEPAVEGNLFRSPLADLLQKARKATGMTMKELTEKVGAHGAVNHGGAVSNWEAGRNTPSRDQYEKICQALLETGKVEPLPPYEDAVRVFDMDKTREFTDVWTFESVRQYRGKHPAEKPIELLEHAIQATTIPGDIVLDCFGGSGNTGMAALNLGRRTVLIEIDNKWANSAAHRVLSHPVVERVGSEYGAVQVERNGHQRNLFSGRI